MAEHVQPDADAVQMSQAAVTQMLQETAGLNKQQQKELQAAAQAGMSRAAVPMPDSDTDPVASQNGDDGTAAQLQANEQPKVFEQSREGLVLDACDLYSAEDPVSTLWQSSSSPEISGDTSAAGPSVTPSPVAHQAADVAVAPGVHMPVMGGQTVERESLESGMIAVNAACDEALPSIPAEYQAEDVSQSGVGAVAMQVQTSSTHMQEPSADALLRSLEEAERAVLSDSAYGILGPPATRTPAENATSALGKLEALKAYVHLFLCAWHWNKAVKDYVFNGAPFKGFSVAGTLWQICCHCFVSIWYVDFVSELGCASLSLATQ